MAWLVSVFASICVCIGYGLGTYFERRGRKAQNDVEPIGIDEVFDDLDSDVSREILETIRGLATTMDDNVQAHSSRVEKISSEFRLTSTSDPKAVLAAAARLVEANKQLHSDLESAKTEIRLQERQIHSYMSEARTDELTGIANRRGFEEELRRRLAQFHRQGTPLSVLLCDVDHFKRFNDYHGHQAGDAVLQNVAEVIRRSVREMDLVTRYGGEEFAVVLPGTTALEAKSAAERIRTAVADHILHFEGADLQVTVSIGAAEALADEDRDRLVKRADAGLYAAKNAGRNYCYLHDGNVCIPVVQKTAAVCK